MNRSKWVRSCTSLMMAASMMLPTIAFAQDAASDRVVQIAPRSGDEVARLHAQRGGLALSHS